METSFKNKLKNLSLNNKVIMAGSFLMALSVFLPWYSDIDQFKTGDTYLGITGPVYLAGLLVLVAGGMSLGITIMHLLKKPIPTLPMKESHFHIATAGLSLLMTIMASSVYFHAKFGVNITSKSAGIGIIVAVVGVALTGFGSFIKEKKKSLDIEEDGFFEPVITVDTQERVQGTLENEDRSVQAENSRAHLYGNHHSVQKPRDMVDEAITVGEAMRRAGQGEGRDISTNDIQ